MAGKDRGKLRKIDAHMGEAQTSCQDKIGSSGISMQCNLQHGIRETPFSGFGLLFRTARQRIVLDKSTLYTVFKSARRQYWTRRRSGHSMIHRRGRETTARTSTTQSLLDQLIAWHQIPGIQYVVVDSDSIRYEYAGGVCDVQYPAAPVTCDTCFLTSSSTKVLTAAAVLKLVEQEKVKLDDPLSKYFKEHPYGDNLHIRHLMNQSSGIPNPMPLTWLHTAEEHCNYSEANALRDALQVNPKLDFQPGHKYAYSNLSYWLLGKVIEQASGKTYREYLHEEILGPLDIDPNQLDCEIPSSTIARGHQPRFSLMTLIFSFLTSREIWEKSVGRWARFRLLYMNGPAYGGIFATAKGGYAKFLQDLLRDKPKLFSKSSTKELCFSEQRDVSGKVLPTTLGWHRGHVLMGVVDDDELTGTGRSTTSPRPPLQHLYFGKPGGGPGYHSNLRIYPKLGIATVFLANTTEVSEGSINALSDLLDKEFLIEANRAITPG